MEGKHVTGKKKKKTLWIISILWTIMIWVVSPSHFAVFGIQDNIYYINHEKSINSYLIYVQ